MKYFTLKDDFEEIQAGKAKSRKRIFVSLSIIVLLVLMRATGVLTLEYHKAYFQGNHSVQKWILETGEEGTKQDFKLSRSETDAEDFNWNLGLNFKFLPGVTTDKTGEYAQDKQYLEELIKKKLNAERNLNNRFEIGAVLVKNSK